MAWTGHPRLTLPDPRSIRRGGREDHLVVPPETLEELWRRADRTGAPDAIDRVEPSLLVGADRQPQIGERVRPIEQDACDARRQPLLDTKDAGHPYRHVVPPRTIGKGNLRRRATFGVMRDEAVPDHRSAKQFHR